MCLRFANYSLRASYPKSFWGVKGENREKPILRFVDDLGRLSVRIASAAQFANHSIATARRTELAAVEDDL